MLPHHRERINFYLRNYLWEHRTEKNRNGFYEKVYGKMYAAKTDDRSELRLHINCWSEFLEKSGIPLTELDIAEKEVPEGELVDYSGPEGFKLRDYQEKIIDHLRKNNKTDIVELHMGGGKTATSLNFISQYKRRLGIVVLGRYTDRWWQDVTQYANQSEILEIRGTKDLAMTIESVYLDPEYLKDIKIILITTTTLQDYISFYEKSKPEERKNLLPPEEIWGVLGIGIKLCDEAHQHFHANFVIDLYTHIKKEIFLSATLNVADSFLKRMYAILYPPEFRIGGGLQKKYTTCTSVRYRFKEPYKIKCKNQKKMYNHTRFEKWLMSSPRLYKRYFEVVIDPLIKSDFIPRREGKYKALVFFATTKMCGLYVEHLKSKYPELDIRRYISEDSYDNLLKADIAVSTLGSAGTAVDIKDLITCIMTTALKSEQANLQALGRLREIPGVKTDFFYLVCDDIPKHVSYHETKKWLFRSWVKSHDDYYVGDRV